MKLKGKLLFLYFLGITISINCQSISYTTLIQNPHKLLIQVGGDLGLGTISSYGAIASGEYFLKEKVGLFTHLSLEFSDFGTNTRIQIGGEYFFYSSQKEKQTSVTIKKDRVGYNTDRITYVKVPSNRHFKTGINLGFEPANGSFTVYTGLNMFLLNYIKIHTNQGDRKTKNYLKANADFLITHSNFQPVDASNIINYKKNALGYRIYSWYCYGNYPLFASCEFGYYYYSYIKFGIGFIITPL